MSRITRTRSTDRSGGSRPWFIVAGVATIVGSCAFAYAAGYSSLFAIDYYADAELADPPKPILNKTAYDLKLLQVAFATSTLSTTTIAAFHAATSSAAWGNSWPAKTVYPNYGAMLPFKRIVAYYGNFYSKQMGALGEYPADEMLQRLEGEVAHWQAADPSTPIVPAIHYIVVTAQASAGKDGKYRARMPDDQIDHALELAKRIDGIVFLDIQVGLSDLPSEVPLLEKYLKMPQVHLAVDPEFAMQPSGMPPGLVVGTYDAKDLNYAATYLANLVQQYNLPPKVFIVHRYTRAMVTNFQDIRPLPEVQIVMHMDGWGSPERKLTTYTAFIQSEPVQFTGFKIFYKNDMKPPSTRLLTPEELLKLKPQPVYIQYQ